MRHHLAALGGLVFGPVLDRLAGLTAELPRPARHSRHVTETAARLIDQGWAAHALVAGAECGLVDALAERGGDVDALAAKTTLPVLGVPVASKHLNGLDSLLSIVQMPGGIPVATFAIGEAGAKNAGLFAVAILARRDPALASRLDQFRASQTEKVMGLKLPEPK